MMVRHYTKITPCNFYKETASIVKYFSLNSKREEKSVAIITVAIIFDHGFIVTIYYCALPGPRI